MSLQYNKIGGHYNALKKLPLGIVQTASTLAHIGNIEGQDVLDLACGTGHYSRKAVERGARRVVGLDISSAMIEAARRELGDDHRLEFRVADCCQPLDVGMFDIVFAMWFLNYAANSKEQLAMWQNMFAHVKPGGRCIGIIPSFDGLSQSSPEYQFGTRMEVIQHVPEGVLRRFSKDDPPISFDSYLLRRDIYESCAQKAGFVDLQWLDPVDPRDPEVDFNAIPRHMLAQVFEARRAF